MAFDIKKYYPDMKVSGTRRGITGSFQGPGRDNTSRIATGNSVNELKQRYLGNTSLQGGPQRDSNNSARDGAIFTEDAVPSTDDRNISDAIIMEPESDAENIVGKKTLITKNGVPKAAQG